MTRVMLDAPRAWLGEGPTWDATRSRLSWVDIDEGRVHAAEYRDGRLGPVTTLEVGGPVGCAIPIAGDRYLVALECWIGILHPSGRLEKSRPLLPGNHRLNDGKIDPQGRLVVGSLRRHGENTGQVLLRLEHDGTVTTLDDDLTLSNGLGWSADGATFYHADTGSRRLYRRSYMDGVAGAREVLAELEGSPDGMTVDTDGRVWVTLFDVGRIDCYAPDGTRLADRTIDATGYHPACAEFIGPALDELVVTTGMPRLDMPDEWRTPGDGALFVEHPGATGVPTTPWVEAPLPR